MHGKSTPSPDDEPDVGRLAARADRRMARSLYFRGWTLQQIAAEAGVKYHTLSSWKRRDGWDHESPVALIEDRIEAKIATLLDKEPFTEGDMKRVDFLMRQLEKTARIAKYATTGKEGDLNPKIAKRNGEEAQAKRAEKRKNHLTEEQWQALEDDFHKHNFSHQALWWSQRDQRTRKELKSRQTGATWYFAREAMMKIRECMKAGVDARNQIFLSASRRQVLIFRRYIVAWVQKVTGVELRGDPIMLDLGEGMEPAGLYFLSTNSLTAQGEHGDFYFDEFFWVHGFAELKKVASAMATHKIYKRTYFSTPSTITHEAYAFWAGEEWNRGRGKAQQQPFDISKRNLRGTGAIMPDGAWQHITTLEDAVAGGMGTLFDVDELRRETGDDEFRNLYDCEFIDDSESSFPWSRLAPARVDSFYTWRDFHPALLDVPDGRPFGENPVWLGYDPNKQGRDDAALVIVAPPAEPGKGKFRVLAKFRLNGLDYQGQADFIKNIAARFNVADIAIDASGTGATVAELVSHWFPQVRRITYSVAVKTALVIKGQNVFRAGRIEFDAGWTDVMASFMAIRPAMTGSGKGVTYIARRNGEVGHADVAWAILHALSNEPLDAGTDHEGAGGFVKFFD